jgi:tripartite-type tricarboxylate transporter receptor subunit TctC
MRKHSAFLIVAFAAMLVTMVACGDPAASPTPAAPATPAAPETKAADPSPAPSVSTPVPAATASDFPQAGRTITLIVPFAAGGSTDVGARMLADGMSNELGVPVQVVNRAGAGGQVGITELARSTPDGYTIGFTNIPSAITIYLDPDRQAAFSKEDLQPLALQVLDPGVIAVKADSPYQDMDDLVEAARANPEQVVVGTAGFGTPNHLAVIQLERETGVTFATVHFEGGAPMLTALLGEHIDAAFTFVADYLPQFQAGEVRLLGVNDEQESEFYPGVRTMADQGYEIMFASSKGLSVPAGTPPEIVTVLSDAIREVVESEEHQRDMERMGQTLRYMGPSEFAAHWDEVEETVAPIVAELRG